MSNAREALIHVMFPYLYQVTPTKTHSHPSSYGIKHDLENALFHHDPERWGRYYFANSETISSLVSLGIPHIPGEPNYGFKVRRLFPAGWIGSRPLASRPKYSQVAQWRAYLRMREAFAEICAELVQGDPSDDPLYTKIERVIGAPWSPLPEVPPCLTARLGFSTTTTGVIGTTSSPTSTLRPQQDDTSFLP